MKVLICILVSLSLISAAKIPSSIKKCRRNDSDCIKESAQQAISLFSSGVLGSTGLDPLHIPSLELPSGSGPIQINQKLSDGIITGFSTAQILELSFDMEAKHVHWKYFVPKLTLEGNFALSGQLLLIPINGNGHCSIIMSNVTIIDDIDVEIYEKNNQEHIKFLANVNHQTQDRVTYNFENLFPGNKLLGDEINRVMNENWETVYNELGISYNSAVSQLFGAILNNFFSKVPISEIFLD